VLQGAIETAGLGQGGARQRLGHGRGSELRQTKARAQELERRDQGSGVGRGEAVAFKLCIPLGTTLKLLHLLFRWYLALHSLRNDF
jgi:hypothetical protein